MPICRRKRQISPISDEIPQLVDEDGNLVDLRDKIAPSKVVCDWNPYFTICSRLQINLMIF